MLFYCSLSAIAVNPSLLKVSVWILPFPILILGFRIRTQICYKICFPGFADKTVSFVSVFIMKEISFGPPTETLRSKIVILIFDIKCKRYVSKPDIHAIKNLHWCGVQKAWATSSCWRIRFVVMSSSWNINSSFLAPSGAQEMRFVHSVFLSDESLSRALKYQLSG